MAKNKWMSQLTGDFGKIASEMVTLKQYKKYRLRSPSFNWATGSDGIPEGKAVLLYGGENGGKSLIKQLIYAQVHASDPEAICIDFDAEYSFNPEWAAKLGVDLDRIIVRQTNNPVEIFDYIWGDMKDALDSGAPIKCIGIDSVKSILYPKDLKDVSTNMTMGGSGASYLGSALKRILPIIREHNITTVLVQQVYEEMDPNKAMNNPYKLPDGRALKHFADLMFQIDRIDTKAGRVESGKTIAGGNAQIGHKIRVKNKKNRVGMPYRVAEFTLDYENGIVNTDEELFGLAKTLDVIYHPINPDTGKVNNQMWVFADFKPVRGEDNMLKWLKDAPQNIKDEVYQACLNVDDDKMEERNSKLKIEEKEVQFD